MYNPNTTPNSMTSSAASAPARTRNSRISAQAARRRVCGSIGHAPLRAAQADQAQQGAEQHPDCRGRVRAKSRGRCAVLVVDAGKHGALCAQGSPAAGADLDAAVKVEARLITGVVGLGHGEGIPRAQVADGDAAPVAQREAAPGQGRTFPFRHIDAGGGDGLAGDRGREGKLTAGVAPDRLSPAW